MTESESADKPSISSPHHKITPLIQRIIEEPTGKTFISMYTQNFYNIQEVINLAIKYKKKICIANSEQIHLLSLDEALTYQHTEITKSVPVNNAASFVFIKNDYLVVGEFNDNEHYITSHPYPSADEDEHRAIVSQYTISSILEEENPDPVAIYSIRDRVQAFAITDEGKIVLSTSWGTSASHFYVYDLGFDPSKELLLPDIEDNNTPVYILDKNNLIEDIKAPSMSEDLDYYDGYVISLSESASNKYIYGKLFFYTDIYALDIR